MWLYDWDCGISCGRFGSVILHRLWAWPETIKTFTSPSPGWCTWQPLSLPTQEMLYIKSKLPCPVLTTRGRFLFLNKEKANCQDWVLCDKICYLFIRTCRQYNILFYIMKNIALCYIYRNWSTNWCRGLFCHKSSVIVSILSASQQNIHLTLTIMTEQSVYRCSHNKIRTAVRPLSKPLNPTLLLLLKFIETMVKTQWLLGNSDIPSTFWKNSEYWEWCWGKSDV